MFHHTYQKFIVLALPLVLVACAGGGGGGGSTGTARAAPIYTSAADFQTTEYNAQSGLALVKASSMYYNGYSRWYNQDGGSGGNPTNSSAGMGGGVKIAVNDSGINPLEAETGSSISIDVRNSYNYVNNVAGSSSDANGHGTHVSGIIAAPKNNSGMQGIAPDATLVNFRIADATGSISLTDSQWASLSTRALSASAYISNNSWGSSTSITSISTATITASNPLTIAAYQNYVANGGLVVFAAGNNYSTQVSVQAGLPYRISGIQAGWLAVMSVDPNGNETAYTNRCGVAKAWCIAAPGGGDNQTTDGIYSMYNNSGYVRMSGTSMATPMVSGAIAGLKTIFPNLSYQQIRDRLLTTANRTGQYANSDIFGQGLMDLGAASSPVGGLSLPTSSSVTGSVSSPSMSKISLPSGTANAIRNSKILLVDGYQRAPFYISASNFVQESKLQSNFAVRHINSLSSAMPIEQLPDETLGYSFTQGLHSAMSLKQGNNRMAFSSGLRSEQPLSRQLGIAYVPHLNNSATNTNGFGYSTLIGNTKIAVLGSLPNTQGQTLSDSLEDKSIMGSRNAFSIISQRDHESFSYGVAYSRANSFTQPLGIVSTGAFGFNGTQASAVGGFFQQSLNGGSTWLKSAIEIATLNASSSGLSSFQNGQYSIIKFGVDHYLDRKTALSIGVKQEQAMAGQLITRIPNSINESGNIGYQNYATGFGSFFNSNQVSLDVHHRFDQNKRIKVGLMYETRPYGMNATGIAAFFEQRL